MQTKNMPGDSIRFHSQGCVWEPQHTSNPILLSAALLRVPLSGRRILTKLPYWVLDYSYVSNTDYRMGTQGSPWLRRLAGEAHLYAPNTAYWSKSKLTPNEVSQSAYITFTGKAADSFIKQFSMHKGIAVFMDREGKLGRLLGAIAHLGAQLGNRSFWRAQALFCQVLNKLTASQKTSNDFFLIPETNPVSTSADFTQQVDHILLKYIGKPVTRREIAEAAHVSVSALSHNYHRLAGISPMQRLLGLRINMAKVLIGKGEGLKTVAEATGFYDAYHLSKTFKKMVGLSPRAYRNHLQK